MAKSHHLALRLYTHRPTAAGCDGDAGNVAEGWLREEHRRRTQDVVLHERDREGRAGASQLVGQQTAQQAVNEVQRATCNTCNIASDLEGVRVPV